MHVHRWKNGSTDARPKADNGVLASLIHQGYRGAQTCITVPTQTARPKITTGGKSVNMAREVWRLAHEDPGELLVLHACHNDLCINIRHLYLGTNADNSDDRRALYEIGRAIVLQRVIDGGPGVMRGVEVPLPFSGDHR